MNSLLFDSAMPIITVSSWQLCINYRYNVYSGVIFPGKHKFLAKYKI